MPARLYAGAECRDETADLAGYAYRWRSVPCHPPEKPAPDRPRFYPCRYRPRPRECHGLPAFLRWRGTVPTGLAGGGNRAQPAQAAPGPQTPLTVLATTYSPKN